MKQKALKALRTVLQKYRWVMHFREAAALI
jgi:hypothetical protein